MTDESVEILIDSATYAEILDFEQKLRAAVEHADTAIGQPPEIPEGSMSGRRCYVWGLFRVRGQSQQAARAALLGALDKLDVEYDAEGPAAALEMISVSL